jgi:HNH endonuclease
VTNHSRPTRLAMLLLVRWPEFWLLPWMRRLRCSAISSLRRGKTLQQTPRLLQYPKPGSASAEGAGKPFSQAVKDVARQESGNRCVLCGRETTSEPGPSQSNIDHSIPRSRGGDNSLDNAQNTCRTCNLAKGTMTTVEFILKVIPPLIP